MKIILTGSSTGIGRAITTHLLGSGHDVWGLARSAQEDLKSVWSSFRASRCDVAHWPQVQQAVQDIGQHWSRVDALITCAGIQGEIGRAVTVDPERWSATVRTNLDGTFYAIRASHRLLMPPQRRAKIVCFSGGGATKSRPHFSAYGAAKTGVVRLVETLAEEEQATELDINAIAPGAINTRLTEEVIQLGPEVVGTQEYEAAIKQRATGGNSLAKVISLVEWLLSPASDGISGRLLSAPWDPWTSLDQHRDGLATSDIYMLRRILPEDRDVSFT